MRIIILKLTYVMLILGFSSIVYSQNVGINYTGAAPNASAILDLSSTSTGLLVPRMTQAQMTAIAAPATSLVIFNTTVNCFEFWTGGLWQVMSCPCTSPAPGTISGNLTPLTNSAGNTYSVAPVPGATGYMWTITPAGATITAGQGSNSIAVSFGPLVQSYTICVYDSSITCIKSPTSCLVVTTTNCNPGVTLDNTVSAAGASTVNITTANPNELIVIAGNGWPDLFFTGPVTVDGNPATLLGNDYTSNSGSASAWAYLAPAAGVHVISVTETGFSSPYYLNTAAAFIGSAPCTSLSPSKTIVSVNAVATNTPVSATVATTNANNYLFASIETNTGITNVYSQVLTGAITAIAQGFHEGNGIDAGEGVAPAVAIGNYTVTLNDVNSCCGNVIILVAIHP